MAVVISSEFVLNEADAAIPLSYPRILYHDVWGGAGTESGVGGTISASSEESGYEGEHVADYFTWDYWRPTSLPATVEVQLDAAADVNYALIAGHTLGSTGNSVTPQYHDGSGWVDLADEFSPGTDHVLAFLFESVTASRFRFLVDGSNSPDDMPSIAVAMMGTALAMQRGVTLNHRPVTMSRKTKARPQISETGQTLGRSIEREGVATEIAFENIEADWLRANFDPFIESARVYPFGWVWHPVSYPSEVAFLWTPSGKEDIVPEHAGLQDRMNVAFEVEGIVE